MLKRSIILSSVLLSGAFGKSKAFVPAKKFYPPPKLANSSLILDRKLSPYMGSSLLISSIRGIEAIEDTQLRKGQYTRGFLPGFVRFCEMGIIYGNLNLAAATIQHEVFGHGYRARDLGKDVASVVDYEIDFGSGATRLLVSDDITASQSLAIDIAGIEAEYILSRELKKKFFQLGSISGREGSLYNFSALGGTLYAMTLSFDNFPGHDIHNFRTTINAAFPGADLGRVELRRKFLLNLIDPMIYYSIWASWNYILFGKNAPIPMFKIGKVKFLPNLRLELSPFGPETYVENYMMIKNKLLYMFVRWGTCGTNEYYGVGIDKRGIYERKNTTFDIRVELWKQPKMALKLGESIPSENLIGALATLRLNVNYKGLGWIGEFGGKTEGFVPGESLKKALIGRFGLKIVF
jgi:hypothetical protein